MVVAIARMGMQQRVLFWRRGGEAARSLGTSIVVTAKVGISPPANALVVLRRELEAWEERNEVAAAAFIMLAAAV